MLPGSFVSDFKKEIETLSNDNARKSGKRCDGFIQPVARRAEMLQSVYYFDEIDNQYKM
jgi:hypothetical protein